MPPTGSHASVDLAWLRSAYVDKQRSIKSIAAEVHASTTTVSSLLRGMGIEVPIGRPRVNTAARTAQYHARQTERDERVWGASVRPVEDAVYGLCYIYLLLDPISHDPHYVGQSTQPHSRLLQHLRCRDHNLRKNDWIMSLREQCSQPLMVVVATCPLEEADTLESEWIERLREDGADLFNQYAPAPARGRITFIPVAELSLAGLDLLPLRQEAGIPSNLLAKIEYAPTSGCWLWTGAKTSGYGVVQYAGRVQRAHRVSYTCLVEDIPTKYVLDHRKDVCGNRSCVYPGHLEPVQNRTNILRGGSPSAAHAVKTHCVHGHEFTPENTRIATRKPPRTPERQCLTCERTKDRARAQAKKASRRKAVS